MERHQYKSIMLNWRWLKLLLPFWIIFGGIPLIFLGKKPLSVCLIVFAVAFIMALAITIFCIRCYIFYLKDMERQKRELDALENELAQLEKENPPSSPNSEAPLQQKPINR